MFYNVKKNCGKKLKIRAVFGRGRGCKNGHGRIGCMDVDVDIYVNIDLRRKIALVSFANSTQKCT